MPTSYAFKSIKKAAKGLHAITRRPVVPYNVSFVDGNHLKHLRELGERVPDPAGALVNVSLEGHPDEIALCDRETETAMGAAGGRRLSDEEALEAWEERSYEFRVKRLGPGLVPGSVFVPMDAFIDVLEPIANAISDLGMKAGITGLLAGRNTVDILPYYIVDDRKMLKNMAVKGGFAPTGVRAQMDIIRNNGRIYPLDDFDNKKRQKIDLPAIPTSCEAVKALFNEE